MERKVAALELAELLRVLAHADRIRIIQELRCHGDLEVKVLRQLLDVPASRLSQHLSLLKSHRVLKEHRDGRRVVYHLDLPDIAGWLLEGMNYLHFGSNEMDEARSAISAAQQQWRQPKLRQPVAS